MIMYSLAPLRCLLLLSLLLLSSLTDVNAARISSGDSPNGDEWDEDPALWNDVVDDDVMLRALGSNDDFDNDFFTKGRICDIGCKDDDDCYFDFHVCLKKGEDVKDDDWPPQCCTLFDGITQRAVNRSKSLCGPPDCNTTARADATFGCFGGDTIVHLHNGTEAKMRDLGRGDRVLTASGGYQSVYAWADRDPYQYAQYLQIFATTKDGAAVGDDDVLEITPDHMIFLEGKQKPIPASSVQVGDFLQQSPTLVPTGKVVVTKIATITRQGLYAPLTEDGTIIVGRVVASNYIVPQQQQQDDDGYVQLPALGRVPFLHQSDVVHLWMAPLRVMCSTIADSWCADNDKGEMLWFADWGLQIVRYAEQQPLVLQIVLLVLILSVLLVFKAVQELLLVAAQNGSSSFLLSLSLVAVTTILRRRKC